MTKKIQALRRSGDSFPRTARGYKEDRAGDQRPEDIRGNIEYDGIS
jgi:hypothetical protein